MRAPRLIIDAGLVLAGVVLLAACGAPAGATNVAADVTSVPVASPKGPTARDVPVVRVVDGDTLHVSLDGVETTVRMIGINTPETVKPGAPIECFGPEASQYTHDLLTGRTVTLEFDRSQGRRDQYGRTLAYVWLPNRDGGLRLVNQALVAGGYAYERQYGSAPYAWRKAFVAAQRTARDAHRGLWASCAR